MQDVRLAFRALRATPVVTIVATLSLALGIGANTALFTLVNSLVLRPLPVSNPERLTMLTGGIPAVPMGAPLQGYTYGIWSAIQERPAMFDGAGAWWPTRVDLSQGGEIQPADGLFVSGELFTMLGVPAALGRTFTAADDRRGGGPQGPVAMISHAFWQRRFGGTTTVIGMPLVIDRVPFTIVGVTPPEFFGVEVGREFDVALPITSVSLTGRSSLLDAPSWYLRIMIRLKADQTIDAATTALRAIQPQLREAAMPRMPEFRGPAADEFLRGALTLVQAPSGTSALRQRYERPLLTIFVVVGLILLVACANIANLQLARTAARRHELSVRLALGASRWRLARQLLVECLTLSIGGSLVGLLVAEWTSRALVTQLSTATNRVVLNVAMDWRVLTFTAVVSIATAMIFGIVPAFRAARVAPIDAMTERGRDRAGASGVSVSSGLVVLQIAVSLVLVVAAGLFVRTFVGLTTMPLGFDADRILVVTVNAARANSDRTDRVPLFQRLAETVAALPGVASAGASMLTPVSGAAAVNLIRIVGAPAKERAVAAHFITPGWLAAYGTAIREGRDFDARDTKQAPLVAIVNEAFARAFLPGRSAVGGAFAPARGNLPARTIVGIVGDAVYSSLRDPIQPTIYLPLLQADFPMPVTTLGLSVRAASGSPLVLTRSIAAALSAVDSNLTFSFRSLADQIGASIAQERLVSLLSTFFGGLALLLAGLGLYGVTAYAVERRRTELGIRMALGASPAAVIRLVLSRVTTLVVLGVIVGAGVSLWASPLVAAMLYGLAPRDPGTLVGASIILGTVGALAGWLPAWRASRVDPAVVLRDP